MLEGVAKHLLGLKIRTKRGGASYASCKESQFCNNGSNYQNNGNGSFKKLILKAQKVRPNKGLSLLGHLERGGGQQEEENNQNRPNS